MRQVDSRNGGRIGIIVGLAFSLLAPAAYGSAVYWTDAHNGAIYRAAGPGAPHRVVVEDAGRPWGVAIDPVNNHLYWGDRDPETAGKIFRVNLDGTGRTVVLAEDPVKGGGTQFVQGVSVDVVNGYVYYTEGNTRTIRRVRTDGTGEEVLVQGRLNGPIDVKLDVANGYMYWTQIISTHSEIFRARLDGSDEQLLFTDQGFFYDLAVAPGRRQYGINYDGEHIYFADQHPDQQAVRRVGVDGGGGAETVVHLEGLEPSGLEIDPDGRWVYFSRRDQPGIWRVGLDGKQLQEVVNPDLFPERAYTIDFTLEHTALFAAAAPVPEPGAAGAALGLVALAALRRARRGTRGNRV
jgi:DNA-binding beta-propeller fold protein YncE